MECEVPNVTKAFPCVTMAEPPKKNIECKCYNIYKLYTLMYIIITISVVVSITIILNYGYL